MIVAIENKENEVEQNYVKKVSGLGYRHVSIVLSFLMFAVAYCSRVTLSVAIVAMTDETTSSNPDVPTYNWTNKSVILSSFFWGYICLQLVAGEIGKRYGTKWIAFIAMFVNSTACILIPLVAKYIGSNGVICCRVLQGLSQGFFFPSVLNILGQWAPTDERSLLGNIIFAGPPFGTIIAMILTGIISSSWYGWPIAFYFFGSLGYAWMLAWMIFYFNSPAAHPKISKEEREYIESSLSLNEKNVAPATPWKSILSSIPVWSIVIAMFGQNWGYSTLLTQIPNYMKNIMQFDMQSNGTLSAAPYVASFILSFVFGAMSDFLINRNYISREIGRKLFNSIGTCVPALALIILGFLDESESTLSVTMLVIAVGMNAACFTGFQINPVDLSPNFSGVIMGLSSGSSNIFSIIAPLIVQFVVTDETDKSLWRIIFITSACIYIASNLFYIVFASGKVQKWNETEAVLENTKHN